MAENGKETRARVSDEVAAAIDEAHPIIERMLGVSLSRTKVLDYLLVRGLGAVGLGRLVEHIWAGPGSQGSANEGSDKP